MTKTELIQLVREAKRPDGTNIDAIVSGDIDLNRNTGIIRIPIMYKTGQLRLTAQDSNILYDLLYSNTPIGVRVTVEKPKMNPALAEANKKFKKKYSQMVEHNITTDEP